MRGGADVGANGANTPTSNATINTPTGGPVSGSSPQANANQVNASNSAQSNQVKTLSGGRGKRGKQSKKGKKNKQRGGMGGATMCTGPLQHSLDGYGYLPPFGCIQVPVLQNPDAQNLAINSVHISAVGQANAQYDNTVNK
jgi:hypothetical protein